MNGDGRITVDMGESVPAWMWYVLDGAGSTENPGTFSAVSMGKPHCIVFVDDMEKDVDFNVDGSAHDVVTRAWTCVGAMSRSRWVPPSHEP